MSVARLPLELGRPSLASDHPHPEPADGRLTTLDGIRGLAIIAVFLFHATFDSKSEWIARWFGWGWMGVDLFFVLSGFLITGILLDAIAQPPRVYYGNFYARRFLRLAPALCLFLAVLFYVMPSSGVLSQNEIQDLREHQGWYWSYLVNVLVAKLNSFGATRVGTAPLWSLSVEEQFYLFWPFLVARAGSVRRVKTLSIVTIVVGMALRRLAWQLGYGGAASYVLTFTRADALAWGALLASLVRTPEGEVEARRLRPVLLILGGTLLAVVAILDPEWPSSTGALVQNVGFPGLAMVSTSLVAYAITTPSRWLAWRPLSRTGFYSYGLYIWHSTLLVMMERVTRLHGLLFVPLGAIVCAVPVALSWLAVERPALRLKHRFPMGASRRMSRVERA